VLQEDGAQALRDAARGDGMLNLRADVGGAAATGAEFQDLLFDRRRDIGL